MSKELQYTKEQNRILIDKYIDVSMDLIDNLVKKIKDLQNEIKLLKEKSVKDAVSIVPKENTNKKLYEYIMQKIKNIQDVIDNISKLSLSDEIKDQFDLIKAKFLVVKEQVKKITENTENGDYVTDINKIYDEIVKLNENLGKVRVFLRIKPLESREPQVSYEIKDKSLVLTCDGKDKTEGGPFYKIIDKDVVNGSDNFKKEIVDDITKELDLGKSLCLFGYGLSGSGKTYTMLGDKGILECIIDIYETIELEYVFEQYVQKFEVDNTGEKYNKLTSISGNIIDLKGNLEEIADIKEKVKEIKEIKNLNKDNINSFLQFITTHRKDNHRIKKTPNNNESSRSTLYLVFKIKDGVSLIIVDCAGRESPKEIKNSLIKFEKDPPKMSEILTYTSRDNLNTLINGIARKNINTLTGMVSDTLIKNYKDNVKIAEDNVKNAENDVKNAEDNVKIKKGDEKVKANKKVIDTKDELELLIKTRKNINISDLEEYKENKENKKEFNTKILNYLQSMFKEGYYINETLNHLIYFLNKKIDKSYKVSKIQDCIETCNKGKYDPKKIFISPEEKSDVIKTMTIMEWIDNLCKPKYMMFCMIRQENDKCIDSAATLNFANSIKST
jgi:hypothetical protein